MFFVIIVTVIVFFVFYSWFVPDPEPVLNIYHKRGKWFFLKYAFMRCCLYITKKRQPFHQMSNSCIDDPKKFGEMYDKAQPLSDSPWAFDAVFFMAANSKGFYLAGGVERRNNRVSNCLLYLVVPGRGLLSNIDQPKTALYPAEEGTFNVNGFRISVVEPMKKWMIFYDGGMRMENGKTCEVHFKGVWSSDQMWFSYDTDLHPHLLAQAFSVEPWNRRYFDTLKKAHQNHYEQLGMLQVSLVIDGSEIEIPITPSFRDHSFGNERDWNLMHRYTVFMIFLENNHFAEVGVVCQPGSFSELYIGFISDRAGSTNPVEWCDLKVYQHGESGRPPTDIAFQFKAGGRLYTVQAVVEHRGHHFKGFNRQIKMFESFFRCTINGTPGVGVSEFCYSNRKVQETEIDSLLKEITGK